MTGTITENIICLFQYLFTYLRRNPPEVRVTSGQKPSNKIIYIVLQTSVGLLNISSKQFISGNTKRRKWMLNFVWNIWKFWWNETDDEILPMFPQNLWALKCIFSRSRGKLFSVLFQAILALRKCKNDCRILKITLVQIFVH